MAADSHRGLPSPMELDHVFILCDEGAPEAEALLRIGIREGSGNTHPGQGTACRRFFFANAYLELVWVDDPAEAGSEAAKRTRLLDRWALRRAGACPFGVIVRPSTDAVMLRAAVSDLALHAAVPAGGRRHRRRRRARRWRSPRSSTWRSSAAAAGAREQPLDHESAGAHRQPRVDRGAAARASGRRHAARWKPLAPSPSRTRRLTC